MSICRERFRTSIKIGLGALLITTAEASAQNGFKAVPLPNPGIPGFKFPEKEATVHQWVKANNQHAINLHAWGIWTALTMDSGETFDGQKLLVFETWHTPSDILAGVKTGDGNRRSPRPLTALHQFTKHTDLAAEGEATVLGFVKYNPTGTEHIIKNKLLSTVSLKAMLEVGKTSIPTFPYSAIALKPVHQPIAQADLESGYYKLPVWPGPYGSPPFPGTAIPYGFDKWPDHVWIDVHGNGSKIANVVKLSDFIHFTLTAEEARLINQGQFIGQRLKNKGPLAKGDYTILLAMHVTTREITRWTWQTFWWTPTPDAPHFPSSAVIAMDRPGQLKGAPANYAHAPAYSMKYPPQPVNGGENVGDSVYSYNPWLEAGFDCSDLPDSKLGTYDDGRRVPNNVGTQSNCMSCHGAATYNPRNIADVPGYSGDRYLDLAGWKFVGTLQVDFLWSIPANAK